MGGFGIKAVILIYAILGYLSGTVLSYSNNPDDIHFFLFPNSNDIREIKFGDVGSLWNAGYDRLKPVVFIIHGGSFGPFNFQSQLNPGEYVDTLKTEYVRQGRSNIIAVDYSAMVNLDENPNMIVQAIEQITTNLPIAGKRIAEFINLLASQNALAGGEDTRNVHLVGWSLGAQLAGTTGAELKKLNSKVIGRISALDPMGLTFGNERPIDIRLDDADADFVDVIFTTSSNTITPLAPIGHVNFYPNAINARGGFPPFGGSWDQPPCFYNFFDLNGSFWCSHRQAWKYFSWSINNPNIEACQCADQDLSNCKQPIEQCPSKTIFGEYVPESARGIYYLKF